MDKKAFAKDLISFIDAAPTAFHAVSEMISRLEKAGFVRLDESRRWTLKPGGAYYVTRNDSAVIAFVQGDRTGGYRIVGSHSDSPTFKIKPNPEMKIEKRYVSLNTEKYGGAILSTWLDRPLSVAGRIVVKSSDPMNPRTVLVRIDRDLLIIPNVAIHMNREVNEGMKFNAQVDTLPLMSLCSGESDVNGMLTDIVAEAAGVKPEDILGQDLYLYDREGGKLIGGEEEFISVGRLDNLAMAHASVEALIGFCRELREKPQAGDPSKAGAFVEHAERATAMVIVNDNEEVGSGSKQGAHSPFLKNLLRRLCYAEIEGAENMRLPEESAAVSGEEQFQIALSKSFLISADQAHAVHPNHPEYHDPTNRPVMGKGVVIKHSANMKYVTDAHSAGVFKRICQLVDEPFQEFVNRSDRVGGSTIGPITSAQIDISGLDIGNPILSMHSIRELGSVDDQYGLFRILREYFRLCVQK